MLRNITQTKQVNLVTPFSSAVYFDERLVAHIFMYIYVFSLLKFDVIWNCMWMLDNKVHQLRKILLNYYLIIVHLSYLTSLYII